MTSLKTRIYLAGIFSMVVTGSSQPVLADDLTSFSAYSSDIHLNHSKGVAADEETSFLTGSSLVQFKLGLLPVSADVDAVHGLPNGDVLFSLETSHELDGTLYRPSDVIRFSGNTWTKEFDGAGEGIPDGVNIDAIAMSGSNLLFSLDVDTLLNATFYTDSDVISFNGASFSRFLDAAGAGIEPASDVDALHVNEQGDVLVSFNHSGELGGVHFRDEDLLAWSSPTWSMHFDASAEDVAWLPADMDAWSIIFFDDSFFFDGFESN
jgi:hypothetical protein